jgi:5-methylcytosine-specific restriction endonuclease McrA
MRDISELLGFLQDTMSMTDIYQPVVILHLLERGGSSTKRDLARTLSGYDEEVQEYYEKILMRWPKITLTKHSIVSYERRRALFSLSFNLDNEILVEKAKALCEYKIREWIEQKKPYRSAARLGASVRYRVLKAARGKCELCGVSSKIVPIDIDHIVPRSQADRYGYVLKDNVKIPVDDEQNLQSLCYRCNRAKRDQDSTDFRWPRGKLIREHGLDEVSGAGGYDAGIQTVENRLDPLFDQLIDQHARLIDKSSDESLATRVAGMMSVLIDIAGVAGLAEADVLAGMRQRRDQYNRLSTGPSATEEVA